MQVTGGDQSHIPDLMKITTEAGKVQLPSESLEARANKPLEKDSKSEPPGKITKQLPQRPTEAKVSAAAGGQLKQVVRRRGALPTPTSERLGPRIDKRSGSVQHKPPTLCRGPSLAEFVDPEETAFKVPESLRQAINQPTKPIEDKISANNEAMKANTAESRNLKLTKDELDIAKKLRGGGSVETIRDQKIEEIQGQVKELEKHPFKNRAELKQLKEQNKALRTLDTEKIKNAIRLEKKFQSLQKATSQLKQEIENLHLATGAVTKIENRQSLTAADKQALLSVQTKALLDSLPVQTEGNKIGCITATDGNPYYFVAIEHPDGNGAWTDKNNSRSSFAKDDITFYTPQEAAAILPKSQTGVGRILQFSNSIKDSLTQACGNTKPLFVFQAGESTSVTPKNDAAFLKDKDKLYQEKSVANDLKADLTLQAKGYLEEGQLCADWATLDHIGNITLAVVSDASGNKPDSHQGAVEDTNRFKKELLSQISTLQQNGELTVDTIATALSNAVFQTEVSRESHQSTSMACTLILNTAEGEKYAVGICIGDARVMIKKEDGSAKDLTPTEAKGNYDDAGAAFGLVARGKDIQPPIAIFQKLEAGDTLLMGSDCFGDNMEAKSNGLSPLGTLHLLDETGKLEDHPELKKLNDADWLKEATTTQYWSLPGQGQARSEASSWLTGLTSDQHNQLQQLHTLYSEHLLSQMDSSKLTQEIYEQCMTSANARGGILRQEIAGQLEAAARTGQQQLTEELKGQVIKREQIEEAEKEACKPIHKNNLEAIKEIANELVKNENNRTKLFEAWDQNPEQAFQWLRTGVGKPDDYSLISLTLSK